jgi:hypothetical protein
MLGVVVTQVSAATYQINESSLILNLRLFKYIFRGRITSIQCRIISINPQIQTSIELRPSHYFSNSHRYFIVPDNTFL